MEYKQAICFIQSYIEVVAGEGGNVIPDMSQFGSTSSVRVCVTLHRLYGFYVLNVCDMVWKWTRGG